MHPHLIILFIVVPMAAGVLSLLCHGRTQAQTFIGLLALGVNCVLAAHYLAFVYGVGPQAEGNILVSQMGNWPAPFGITVVVDTLAAMMLAVGSVVCLAVFIYCISHLSDRFGGGLFHPLFHVLVMGVQWSFITGDLFNLFVAFEIMLTASYGLFVAGTTRAQIRHAYKYVILNLLASTLFVSCAGLVYGQLGTLNLADIARIGVMGELPRSMLPVIAVLLLVFAAKTAVFPLWFWLPDTYHTLPAPIGGLFAGLLTKVGAYVMIRVFVMVFGAAHGVWQDPNALPAQAAHAATGTAFNVRDMLVPLLLVAAPVTMFVGVLGAVSMHSVRRILSIHIISQVGYMVLGIGLAIGLGATDRELAELALAGAIFFIVHNMAVKCCLFLCAGLMQELAGSDDLEKIGGLVRRAPWLATLFLIAALSLAGLPPLSGFFGKWVLIYASFLYSPSPWVGYTLAGFAIATSLLTLLSMLKIWSYGFWSPAQGAHADQPRRAEPRTFGGLAAIAVLVVVALTMGLGAPFYLGIARSAARTLVQPDAYIRAVLGNDALHPTYNTATGPMPPRTAQLVRHADTP